MTRTGVTTNSTENGYSNASIGDARCDYYDLRGVEFICTIVLIANFMFTDRMVE